MYAAVDCNSFFVACEKVFRPELEGKPVVVLSNNDDCIIARSREAKALGLPMGAPRFKYQEVMEKNGVIAFSPNFGLYGDMSQRILSILETTSAEVEPYSVDEAFLRLSTENQKDPIEWSRRLRDQIVGWTGIAVSIGLAPTKTLAKAGCELAKQDPSLTGVAAIDKANLSTELAKLSVGDIWGFGRRLTPKLNTLGIKTAADLLGLSNEWMRGFAGLTGERTLRELKGEDVFGMRVTFNEPAKHTLAATRTFGQTIYDINELKAAVASFAVRATHRLRRQGKIAGAISVFLSSGKHTDHYYRPSTWRPLSFPSADTGMILEEALGLVERIYNPAYGYKRAGVVLFDLVEKSAQQLSLTESVSTDDLRKREGLMAAFDQIRQRYGSSAVGYAVEAKYGWLSRREHLSPRYTTSWSEVPVVRA